METTQEVLERRYRSRALSRRYAKDNARHAASKDRHEEAAEYANQADQHLGALGEITKIAYDLGICLDTYSLNQQAQARHDEIEQTLRVFEATRAEGE